jgi:hypothetical protein
VNENTGHFLGLFFLAGTVYGQVIMIRPNSSIGYFSADDVI